MALVGGGPAARIFCSAIIISTTFICAITSTALAGVMAVVMAMISSRLT